MKRYKFTLKHPIYLFTLLTVGPFSCTPKHAQEEVDNCKDPIPFIEDLYGQTYGKGTQKVSKFSGSVEAEVKLGFDNEGRVSSLVIYRFPLKKLPTSINELRGLKNLSIVDCNLSELPEITLPQLEYLSLEDNDFTQVPQTIKNIRTLGWLDMTKNSLSGSFSIQNIPTSVWHLNLSDNDLKGIIVDDSSAVRRLNISNNASFNVDESLCKLTKLEFIDLTSGEYAKPVVSKLRSIDCLKHLEIITHGMRMD